MLGARASPRDGLARASVCPDDRRRGGSGGRQRRHSSGRPKWRSRVNRVITLTEREVRSFFLTPVGYIVIALFVVFASLVFNAGFEQGQPASMQNVFRWGMWILLV